MFTVFINNINIDDRRPTNDRPHGLFTRIGKFQMTITQQRVNRSSAQSADSSAWQVMGYATSACHDSRPWSQLYKHQFSCLLNSALINKVCNTLQQQSQPTESGPTSFREIQSLSWDGVTMLDHGVDDSDDRIPSVDLHGSRQDKRTTGGRSVCDIKNNSFHTDLL